jgi:hypothetical protein
MSICNEQDTPEREFDLQLRTLYDYYPKSGVPEVNGPNDHLFYTASTVPTLSQAKGQIVVFRRYHQAVGELLGIDATFDWPDDSKTSKPTSGPVPMMIQDIYKMRFANQGDVKWEDHVLDFLNKAMADPKTSGTWWINFTSTSGGGLPRTFAAEVNELFKVWLEKQIGTAAVAINRLGTIPMDFPEKQDLMIDALIATNFVSSANLMTNRDYTFRLSLSNDPLYLADCHQTIAGGTYYGWVSAIACKHRLVTVGTNPHGYFIEPGTVVYLQTMQPDMGISDNYVYLSAYGQFNLYYSNRTDTAEQWSVERVDPSISGYIAKGERVRFKSLHAP